MIPAGMPTKGTPLCWESFDNLDFPEWPTVHWGEIEECFANGSVKIRDDNDEVFYMPYRDAPYVPGYEPKQQGSVWD